MGGHKKLWKRRNQEIPDLLKEENSDKQYNGNYNRRDAEHGLRMNEDSVNGISTGCFASA